MPTVTIRQVQGEELLDTMFPLGAYAFAETPTSRDREELQKYLPYQIDRHVVCVFEDEVPVAVANSVHMTQNVRGKVYRMGGIAGVATLPQARRKGYARQMVKYLFENMKDESQAVASLYPFRESFYGRLGYIGLPPMRLMQITPLNLSPILKSDIPGVVEVIHLKEGADEFITFLKNLLPQVHGMALHPDSSLAGMKEFGNSWLALARHNGEVVGAMVYRLMGFNKDMKARYFLHKNSVGKYLLLQWIARHADQVSDIYIKVSPADIMETWFFDMRAKMHTRWTLEDIPTPMGRVAIVEEIGGMQVGPGHFTARIIDEQCDWNNGVFRFESVDGLLEVTPAADADCELTIQGLSGLVFCGYDPADFMIRGWGNPSPETQAAIRTMFPPAYPFLHGDF